MSALRDRAKQNPPDTNALNSMIRLLNSRDSFERTAAVAYLGEVGSNAEPAVDPIVEILNDSDGFAAREAAKSLGEIGPKARRAVPDLLRRVKQQPDADVGWFSAESLGQIANSNDVNVLAALRLAAKSSDERMRNSANEGLQALGIKNQTP